MKPRKKPKKCVCNHEKAMHYIFGCQGNVWCGGVISGSSRCGRYEEAPGDK